MSHQRARLAYEASLRALEDQQRELGEIRSRTGILLGASSLTASVLGARALDEGLAPLGVLALAALVLTLFAGTLVLVPKASAGFAISGPALYRDLAGLGDRDQLRYLAFWLDDTRAENDRLIGALDRRFRVAVASLVLQVLFSSVAVTGTIGFG